MQTVFEALPLSNFGARHVISCSLSPVQRSKVRRRVFAGTSDGKINVYDCREESSASQVAYMAMFVEAIKITGSREQACVSQLITFDVMV